MTDLQTSLPKTVFIALLTVFYMFKIYFIHFFLFIFWLPFLIWLCRAFCSDLQNSLFPILFLIISASVRYPDVISSIMFLHFLFKDFSCFNPPPPFLFLPLLLPFSFSSSSFSFSSSFSCSFSPLSSSVCYVELQTLGCRERICGCNWTSQFDF